MYGVHARAFIQGAMTIPNPKINAKLSTSHTYCHPLGLITVLMHLPTIPPVYPVSVCSSNIGGRRKKNHPTPQHAPENSQCRVIINILFFHTLNAYN